MNDMSKINFAVAMFTIVSTQQKTRAKPEYFEANV